MAPSSLDLEIATSAWETIQQPHNLLGTPVRLPFSMEDSSSLICRQVDTFSFTKHLL
jgi:hypothetical protein